MDLLFVILIITASLLLLLVLLATFTLFKLIKQRRKQHALNKPAKHDISDQFHVPISYRVLKAQTPFLTQEDPYSLSGDEQYRDQLMSMPRKASAPPSISMSHSPEGSLVDLLPTHRESASTMTTIDKKQRRISLGVMEHLAKQGRRVSMQDLRNASITEEVFLNSMSSGSRAGSMFGDSGDDSSNSFSGMSGNEDPFDSSFSRKKMKTYDENNSTYKKSFKKTGKITFTTLYVIAEHSLHVHLIRAFDLANRRDASETHPFVRLYLMPGKKQKHNTKYQKATKQPFFNETVIFNDLEPHDLQRFKLKLRVVNHNRLRRKEVLGEVDVALSSIDQSTKETFNLDLLLQRAENSMASLCVLLCHQATKSKLDVVIKEAKNLPKYPNAYVSVSLFREHTIERKETAVKRNARDPVFEEKLEFDVRTDFSKPLTTFSLVATVINSSLVGKDEVLGHVIFNMTSPQKTAVDQWRRTQDAPHRPHWEWHSLVDPEDL